MIDHEPLENPDIVVRRAFGAAWWFEPISRPAEDFLAAFFDDDRPATQLPGGKEISGTKSFKVPEERVTEAWRAAEAKGLVLRHVG